MVHLPEQPDQIQKKVSSPIFNIQKLYIKDISLESPNAPTCFVSDHAEPHFEVQFRNEAKMFEHNFFEVSLIITLKAAVEEKTIFLIELTQAGLFQIENTPPQDLDPILGIVCPNILFPYLREAISDLTTRAGFLPFILQPINFEAIFAQQQIAKNEKSEIVVPNQINGKNDEIAHQ